MLFKFHKLFTNLDKLMFKVSGKLTKYLKGELSVAIFISKQIDKGRGKQAGEQFFWVFCGMLRLGDESTRWV
jgi:hypothetical protein